MGTNTYSRPADQESEEWQRAIQQAWGHSDIPVTDMGQEWTVFCARAEAAMRSASLIGSHAHGNGKRDKGSVPRLAKVGSHACYRENEVDHHQRRHRHFIGRLHELFRQQQRDASLQRVVERTWPSDIPPPSTLPRRVSLRLNAEPGMLASLSGEDKWLLLANQLLGG